MHRKPKTPEASAAAPITSNQRDVVPMAGEKSGARLDDEVEGYVGELVDGQRHGLGTQTYPNGASYTGEWQDNHPDGWGVIRTTSGRQTIGRLEINQRHGRGVQFFANGEDDDNNRIYWEHGELVSQAEWFVEDNAQAFEAETRRMRIPLSDNCVFSKEERTYILAELAGDWILEVPGMSGLALLSIAYLHQKGVMQGDISSRQGLSKLLAKDSKGIAAFCRKRNLSPANSERLAHWAEWSRSSEKEAAEDYLRSAIFRRHAL